MPDNMNPRLYARGYAAPGAPGTTVVQKNKPQPCTCAPACECGLLECVCRPRFFAGQLLTEQDLNRLDAYIRAKNRLHTLQLHGSGVVNGLEVRCEPCGTGVVVGMGYAISPCGDDIVVCCDTPVDVCALVKKCQPPDATCQPYLNPSARGCDDVVQDWVLSIRYSESPARGVAALRIGPTCSCGASSSSCSCGKSAGTCGCGSQSSACSCGGKKGSCGCGKPAQTCTTSAKPRDLPAECEPTVICEGYSFDVCLAPKPEKEPRTPKLDGALPQNFLCCLQPLMDLIPAMPGTPNDQSFQANPQAWNLWCCQTKQAMIDYFSTGPEADCTIVGKLVQWSCPDPNDQNFASEMDATMAAFGFLFLEAMLSCLCHALLPPPPCGTTDDRIPLAIVRVRKKDCAVVSVCNFTPLRKTVLSFPALEYWFGWLPIWKSLCDMIHNLCCRSPFQRVTPRMDVRAEGVAVSRDEANLRANPTLSPDLAVKNEVLASLVMSAFARGQTPLDPKAIVSGVFGVDLGSKQTLSEQERANAPQFLLLNQVMRPIAASVVGGASFEGMRTVAASAAETNALKERIAKLEETVNNLRGRR